MVTARGKLLLPPHPHFQNDRVQLSRKPGRDDQFVGMAARTKGGAESLTQRRHTNVSEAVVLLLL